MNKHLLLACFTGIMIPSAAAVVLLDKKGKTQTAI